MGCDALTQAFLRELESDGAAKLDWSEEMKHAICVVLFSLVASCVENRNYQKVKIKDGDRVILIVDDWRVPIEGSMAEKIRKIARSIDYRIPSDGNALEGGFFGQFLIGEETFFWANYRLFYLRYAKPHTLYFFADDEFLMELTRLVMQKKGGRSAGKLTEEDWEMILEEWRLTLQ